MSKDPQFKAWVSHDFALIQVAIVKAYVNPILVRLHPLIFESRVDISLVATPIVLKLLLESNFKI